MTHEILYPNLKISVQKPVFLLFLFFQKIEFVMRMAHVQVRTCKMLFSLRIPFIKYSVYLVCKYRKSRKTAFWMRMFRLGLGLGVDAATVMQK